MPDTDFVVYGYLRKDYSSFYYIGKGRPDRPFKGNRRTIPHPGCRSRIVILYKNIEEQVALDIEKKLIFLIGRIGFEPWGTLRNINPGGEGVSKKHSEELKQKKYLYRHEKLSQKRKNWFHSVVGEVYNLTHKELSEVFPEQRLNAMELLSVSKGRKNFYLGWRLLENQVMPNSPNLPIPRDWYHPDHGEIFNKTCREIMETYGDGDMRIDSLKRVASGYVISSMGWRLLKNKSYTVEHRNSKKANWYHPDHGEILNVSCGFIVKNFYSEGLSVKKLNRVRSRLTMSHLQWTLLGNKGYIHLNKKLENWEHEEYGVVKGASAGDLVKMFPKQMLLETSLRRVARNPTKRSCKGWFVEGHLRVKSEEKRANWYHPDHGAFFNKTAREIRDISGDPKAKIFAFERLISGRWKTTRGWMVLKKP